MSPERKQITIGTDSINLDQFLKWARIAVTGGQAKMMIIDGLVAVNGEVETRRSRKLYPGDHVDVRTGDGSIKLEVSSPRQE